MASLRCLLACARPCLPRESKKKDGKEKKEKKKEKKRGKKKKEKKREREGGGMRSIITGKRIKRAAGSVADAGGEARRQVGCIVFIAGISQKGIAICCRASQGSSWRCFVFRHYLPT